MTGVEHFQPGGEDAVSCHGRCPLNTAVLLGQIADQVTQPLEWLMADYGDTTYGPFTVTAVQSVVERYHVAGGPSACNYGHTKEPAKDIVAVNKMQRRLMGGEKLDVRDIGLLQRAVLLRNQRHVAFAALPDARRKLLFEDARPLMEEDLIIGITEESRQTASDPRVAALLQAREAQGAISPSDYKIGQDIAARAYTFDQAPFLVAGYALQHCGGPWRTFTDPLFRQPQPIDICPHGSPRGDMYSRAAASAGGEPHPG